MKSLGMLNQSLIGPIKKMAVLLYAQIGEKGTVYDSMTLNIRWSYGFEVDFTNIETAPHPYFAGKDVTTSSAGMCITIVF